MSKILDKSLCSQCVYRTWAFNRLTSDELQTIEDNKQEIYFYKGEAICYEGQKIEHFLYLRTGLVKLFSTGKNEKEHIISIGKPLDFISLLNIFSNEHHIYTITAIESSVVCFVDLDIIKKLIRQNGDFALEFMEKLSKVSDDVIKTRLNINTRQLRGRIAYILMFFSSHIYGKADFELPISRKEIAQLIDMSTENVIRILSEFRKDGLIDIEGKHIRIKNADKLNRIYELG